jgi:hypothetical protein
VICILADRITHFHQPNMIAFFQDHRSSIEDERAYDLKQQVCISATRMKIGRTGHTTISWGNCPRSSLAAPRVRVRRTYTIFWIITQKSFSPSHAHLNRSSFWWMRNTQKVSATTRIVSFRRVRRFRSEAKKARTIWNRQWFQPVFFSICPQRN